MFKGLCLKTNSVTPIFFLLKNDEQAKTKLSAKLKKFRGADSDNFFKLCRKFYPSVVIAFQQQKKKGGHRVRF